MESVLISGGSGGIGESIVKSFSDLGYRVIIVDKDKENGLLFSSKYSNCHFIEGDLLDDSFYIELKNNPLLDSGISHLVSLAGGSLRSEWNSFKDTSFNDIDTSVNLNLTSHLKLINTLIPSLEKSSSSNKSICLISSINAMSWFSLPSYSSAKSGIYGLIKSLAPELGESGIRINCVSPGTVITPATASEPKDWDSYLKGTCLGYFADCDDIAEGVVSLCKIKSITGHNLVIDSGQLLK